MASSTFRVRIVSCRRPAIALFSQISPCHYWGNDRSRPLARNFGTASKRYHSCSTTAKDSRKTQNAFISTIASGHCAVVCLWFIFSLYSGRPIASTSKWRFLRTRYTDDVDAAVSGFAAAPTHQHTFPTVDRRAETRRPENTH